MDIRIFHKKDGGIVQLIDKEKIKDWSVELPLKFVEDVRSKLKSYRDAKVEEEISAYLDDIIINLAIPKIKETIEDASKDTVISILSSFEELSETNLGAIKPIQPLLENLTKNSNKTIAEIAKRIIDNLLG
ncbi:MAG: hypothetical protein ACFFFT_03125 [Candidatus Thorarchaeota archaeon]